MDLTLLPADHPKIMRMLIKHQGTLSQMFEKSMSKDRMLPLSSFIQILKNAGIVPRYFSKGAIQTLIQEARKQYPGIFFIEKEPFVDEDKGDEEAAEDDDKRDEDGAGAGAKAGDEEEDDTGDKKGRDVLNAEGFAYMIVFLASNLTWNFNDLAKWNPKHLRKDDRDALLVCLLIVLMARRLGLNPSSKCMGLPVDIHDYPLVRAPLFETLQPHAMCILIRLQTPVTKLFSHFADGGSHIELADLEDELRELEMIPIYMKERDFHAMAETLIGKIYYDKDHPSRGKTPVFEDPRGRKIDVEGFSFLLNHMVDVIDWNRQVLVTVLNGIDPTPHNLHSLKLCFLIQWLYTKIFEGDAELQPEACRLKPKRKRKPKGEEEEEEEEPKEPYRPGPLIGNPMVPLFVSELEEELAKMKRESRTGEITFLMDFEKGLQELAKGADGPGGMPGSRMPPGPRPRDLTREAHGLAYKVSVYLKNFNLYIVPEAILGKLTNINVAEYVQHKLDERPGWWIIAPHSASDLVRIYLVLLKTKEFMEARGLPFPPFFREALEGVNYEIAKRNLRQKRTDSRGDPRPTLLTDLANFVRSDLVEAFPELNFTPRSARK